MKVQLDTSVLISGPDRRTEPPPTTDRSGFFCRGLRPPTGPGPLRPPTGPLRSPTVPLRPPNGPLGPRTVSSPIVSRSRPGATIQVSVHRDRWASNTTLETPRVAALVVFLKSLCGLP
jgi:hypothetical protein